jgi:hypothetical protein
VYSHVHRFQVVMQSTSLNGEDETTKRHEVVLVDLPRRVALSGAFSHAANQKT